MRLLLAIDPNAKSLYMEGSVWHVRVLDSNGDAVLDRRVLENNVSMQLKEGRYRLESEELPCDGNCSHLDPGMDSCSTELDSRPGAMLLAKVTLKPAEGCKIDVDA